jgi:hypothetical protein
MPVSVAKILPPDWLDVFSPVHPRIGIGLDPATTTKDTSNPSGLSVVQQVGLTNYARLVLRYKTDDPDVTTSLCRQIVTGLGSIGLHVRQLCILATNERFFAAALRKQLAPLVPVHLVIESEKTQYLGEEMLYKAYLGNLFVNTIEDGYLPLPPTDWLKKDLRLVVRDRGTFDSALGEDGGHGDTFASTGAALHAVRGAGGKADVKASGPGQFNAQAGPGRKVLNPYARERRPGGRLAT